MSSQWYYRLFDEEFGPIDFEGLTGLRDSGMLDGNDQVRPADSPAWITLTQALAAPASTPVATAAPPAKVGESTDTDDGWYYDLAGSEMGPLTFEELIEAAERGTLTADDQVKMGRNGKYRRAGSIGRLVTHLPYADSAATPAPPTKSSRSTPVPEETVVTGLPTAPLSATAAPPAPSVPMVRHHPAAEEPEWYAWIRGIEMGPTSLLQLAQWVKTGQITPTDLVRCGKSGTWMPPTPTIEQALARLVMIDAAPAPPPPPQYAMPPQTAFASPPAMPQVAPPPPAKKAPALRLPDPPPKEPVPPPTAAPRVEPAANRVVPQAEPAKPSIPESRAAAAPPSRPADMDAPTPPKSPAPEPRPAYTPPPAASSPSTNGAGSRPGSYGGSSPYGGSSSYAAPAAAKPAYKPPPKKKSSGGGGGFSLNLGELFQKPEDQAKFGGVAVLLLFLGWLFLWPESTSEERAHLEMLQGVVSEFQAKREAKANKIEIDQFAAEKSKEIRAILEKLQPKATGEYPARQNLVFAMQQIPRMMETSRDKASPAETQVEYFLKKAAFLLGDGEDPDKDLPPPDPNATDPSMAPPPT